MLGQWRKLWCFLRGSAQLERSNSFSLPDGLRAVTLEDSKRKLRYALAFSNSPSEYEAAISNHGGPDVNARLIGDLLQGRGTLIDVGANIGTIAVPIAVTGSEVICIEMNPTNCLKLMTSANINNFDRFHIIQAAASERDGITTFAGDEAWGQITEGSPGVPVIKLRLDTVLQMVEREKRNKLDEPLLIKIDVEGHEPQVLRGATELLSSYRPLIIFEAVEIEGFAPSPARETKTMLEKADYELFLIHGNILSPRTSSDVQEMHVGDFLAIPSDRCFVLRRLKQEVREMSDAERIAIVSQGAKEPAGGHQRNAAMVISRWATERPDLAEQMRESVYSLLNVDNLADLHWRLAELLPQTERARSLFSTSARVIHNQALCDAIGTSLRITTPRQQWSYAIELPLQARQIPKDRCLKIELNAYVRRGAVGLGILGENGTDFVREIEVAANKQAESVEIVIPANTSVRSIIVRNVYKLGSSEVDLEIRSCELLFNP